MAAPILVLKIWMVVLRIITNGIQMTSYYWAPLRLCYINLNIYIKKLNSMKKSSYALMLLFIFFTSCKVTFITGYDEVLDQTLNTMKKEFNVHFIKLSRTIQDNNPNNQAFANFQDYYDNLEADLITINDRTKFLDGKAGIVKQQVQNLDSAFRVFINLHKSGLADRAGDDRHDMRDAINSSINAVTILQEALKSSGSAN
jgi:hypothetical protein